MNHIDFLEKLHDLTFKPKSGAAALADISELLERNMQGALDSAYDTRNKMYRLENKAVNARRVRSVRRTS